MKLPRRKFLHLAAGAAALPALSRVARAQSYPSRPVRLVAGFAAGGAVDIVARLIGQWLSERLGQQIVIENRPGAGSNIATEAVVNAPPDGHTLLLVAPANAVNVTLYEKLSYNFARDIVPVSGIIRTPVLMLVNPSFPAATLSEFMTYAKANPGMITMGSGGVGSTPHICGELFQMMTGVSMVHVPYRGEAPALGDLIGGQVQVVFGTLPAAREYVRADKLRALAVTTATRTESFPGVPSVGEFVAGYEASGWYGIGAPKGTPAEIVDRLNREINAGLVSPGMKARFADLGVTEMPGSPADFGKLVAAETEKWAKVIKFSGARPE